APPYCAVGKTPAQNRTGALKLPPARKYTISVHLVQRRSLGTSLAASSAGICLRVVISFNRLSIQPEPEMLIVLNDLAKGHWLCIDGSERRPYNERFRKQLWRIHVRRDSQWRQAVPRRARGNGAGRKARRKSRRQSDVRS